MSDDEQDFREPSELISAATLAEWEDGGARFNGDGFRQELARYTSDNWFDNQDPAVVQLLEEAANGWAEGPADANVSGPGREVERHVSTQATRTGYLIGRMILKTVDKSLRWSADVDEGAEAIDDLLQQIDFTTVASLAGESLNDLTISLADEWTAEHGLSAENDEIGNVVFLAFDNALTLALVEHDIVLGRTP